MTIYKTLSHIELSDNFEYNGDDALFWTTPNPVEQLWAVRPDRSEIVRCANMASARAIAEGRAPNKVEETTYTYKAVPFVSPTGQYYVEIHAGSQVVRMDVANAQTARYYARNGVSCDLATTAYLANLNQ
tara:strand:+ start:926 stop:1315 length:390 start_codon:yes stop_codon:yes gene_type:complete